MAFYNARNQIRIVTATSLFDGHDASINIIRRILQEAGAEVIHLGHNRSAQEIVKAAIEEDVQGIAVSSYQGGHLEYYGYIRQLLDEGHAPRVRIYGGGGGVIVPREIRALEEKTVQRIFSPDDGRTLGLEGMVNTILEGCDYSTLSAPPKCPEKTDNPDDRQKTWPVGRLVTAVEMSLAKTLPPSWLPWMEVLESTSRDAPTLGITGPGGAGKSTMTDELVRRFLADFPHKKIAVLCVDPSKRRTGGALLGDRLRMNAIHSPRVFVRSLATRHSSTELSSATEGAVRVCQAAGFDLIVVESAGSGQKDSAVHALCDVSLYVMTQEFGAPTQLEKIEMIDISDCIAINKAERRGSQDALHQVRKQYCRSRGIRFSIEEAHGLPVFATSAHRFNDSGTGALYQALLEKLQKSAHAFSKGPKAQSPTPSPQKANDPKELGQGLLDVTKTLRRYQKRALEAKASASRAYTLFEVLKHAHTHFKDLAPLEKAPAPSDTEAYLTLVQAYNTALDDLEPDLTAYQRAFRQIRAQQGQEELSYKVRGRTIKKPLYSRSLSGTGIPKLALPQFSDWGDLLLWLKKENLPGAFPFTAGVFPLKRTTEEAPTRMFAGEGPPERTNQRFHLLSQGFSTARLSTAFDSVTLYGEDPDERPDIFGKIGESGVSVATVEDIEKLYAGFRLSDPKTSVSMTINGPAPIILAFFMNAAIRQDTRFFLKQDGRLPISDADCLRPDHERGDSWANVRAKLSDEEFEKISLTTLGSVRGTVQADILKEDQAQNTCIFSTGFALKMMGDVQAYFIEHNVRNYYSVSISGYHIAEAGANPITQLALTLANGFTYVQYYLSRGMAIDDFAPNLSFFFSNGLDPEYAVIGRVARRIWAVALRDLYGANERSQKLKYHIQTSGRSLHAMEMDFNDIRTTLQALMAIQDNCNSLHTNAFDEALTTPTENSVRRALAIQMIINRELGLSQNENPLQGSFFMEALTDLVEAAVLEEFDRLSERGGVLGAMETQYQRNKIQEESLHYERLKHEGHLPVIGVNTFVKSGTDYAREADKVELRRTDYDEKRRCIARLKDFQGRHKMTAQESLTRLRETVLNGGNIFCELMETTQYASLGQITHALYDVGGKYRRNM